MLEIEDESDSTYLGKRGENFFSNWCLETSLIPQRPTEDETGWDFYVEFPKNDDKDELYIRIKVQVKSTNDIKRKWQIKLSNLHKFVGAPLPAFICFIEFDGKKDPERAYFVHIDNQLSEDILKKVTKLKFSGDTDLHRHTYTIKYGDTDIIEPLNGKGLRKKILNFLPEGYDTYVQNKIHFIKNVGFECSPHKYKMILTIKPEELIDLSLGIRKEVKVLDTHLFKSRFGIVEPSTFKVIKNGSISIRHTPKEVVKVDFKTEQYGIGLSFEGNLYLPPSILANMFLEKQYKFKVISRFFEFIAHPYENTGKFTFIFSANDEVVKISEFKKASKLFFLFRNLSKRTVYLKLFSQQIGTFGCELEANEVINEFSDIVMIIEAAYEIASKYELQDSLETTFDELFHYEEYTLFFYNICIKPENEFYIAIKKEKESNIVGGKEYGVILQPIITKIGKYFFICILALIGKVKITEEEPILIEGEEYNIIIGRAKYHKHFIIEDENEISNIDLSKLNNEINQEMERDYIVNIASGNSHINNVAIKLINVEN